MSLAQMLIHFLINVFLLLKKLIYLVWFEIKILWKLLLRLFFFMLLIAVPLKTDMRREGDWGRLTKFFIECF